ncbi:hypothetical protein FACS1894179_10600 [Bacteroidia bacterium]|nr:hypothetical protein FACS1894169_11370 [Bacteroidia bacterium]GHV41995.1 hypothetical protein FACS1894179_10600 [Bacteroidia bacterium]
MKKLFILVAAIAMLYSCGGNTQKTQEQTTPETTQIGDGHNARNSLDYQGTYTGKVPTASGEGMLVSLTLEDSTYVKKTEYIGKKEIFEDKGKYTWNAEGNTVILDGIKGAPNQYFVGENTLIQLDMEGKKITGELADQYILTK